jgi:hypothetical protein
MTVDLINSILLPPFLFIVFFSFASILFYQPKSVAVSTLPIRDRVAASRSVEFDLEEIALKPTVQIAAENISREPTVPVEPSWVALTRLLDEEEDLCEA